MRSSPRKRPRTRPRAALALIACVAALCAPLAAAEPLVFAAASTAKALDAALSAYAETTGARAVPSYAASGVLARQIAQGAPADLFLSANPKWMAYLVEEGRVAKDAPQPLLSNRLVLIAPTPETGAAAPLPLAAAALAERLGPAERWAMADPDSAPVGRYGQAALKSLDLWATAAPRLVAVKDTRAAVALVERREVAFALVYATDAAGVAGVSVVAEIPRRAHPEILYPAALVADAPNPAEAAALLAFLSGEKAAEIFAAHGFATVFATVSSAGGGK